MIDGRRRMALAQSVEEEEIGQRSKRLWEMNRTECLSRTEIRSHTQRIGSQDGEASEDSTSSLLRASLEPISGFQNGILTYP